MDTKLRAWWSYRQGLDGSLMGKTARKLVVTNAEIAKLKSAIVKALNKEPLDPDALRTSVGNAARSLGPEGVKKGLTTTLPLALGLLQSEGAIRRVPINGRIDRQRYKYALWKIASPGSFTDLASHYFRWIGAASLSAFQRFSGLGVKAAKEAIAPLNLVTLQADLLASEEDRAEFESFQTPKQPHYILTGILDNISHLHHSEFPHHLIVDRGDVVGLWHFDPETNTIAWNASIKKNRSLEEAVARTETFIREDLGDALAALREAAGV